jgi:hypothetical protein
MDHFINKDETKAALVDWDEIEEAFRDDEFALFDKRK